MDAWTEYRRATSYESDQTRDYLLAKAQLIELIALVRVAGGPREVNHSFAVESDFLAHFVATRQ